MEKNGKKPVAVKSRGPFHMLRVAFYMLRRRSSRKSAVDVVQKSGWRRLMAAMRPLQATCIPPASPAPAIKGSSGDEFYHEVTIIPPPLSPAYKPRVFEDGMSSRYASAEDLQQLDMEQKGEEAGNPSEIDRQAEEFIAKFYEEIRLQRIESMERHNKWLEKEKKKEKEEAVEEQQEETLDVISACVEGAGEEQEGKLEMAEHQEGTVEMSPACRVEVAEQPEITVEIIPACQEGAAEEQVGELERVNA